MAPRFLTMLLAATIPMAAARADWAPPADYIARQSVPFFEGKKPEQIARYLAHFNDGPHTGAVLALAAHGDSVLPLLEKLMGDTNPWVRAGAVETVAELCKRNAKDKRETSPQLSRCVAMAFKQVNDAHPAVQNALAVLVGDAVQVETAETRKIALQMAASKDPAARTKAIRMAQSWIKDPDTVVRIGMLASAAPFNTPGDWDTAHGLIKRYSTQPVARQAIPTMAEFLRNKANTRPYRGFFSDNGQFHAMIVMRDQWDAKVEKMTDVVPGICRCYTRVPYHKYPGWVKTRNLAWELLQKCSAASAPAIRATIAEEKKWLAEVPDVLLQTTTETDPTEARKKALELIGDLEKLAAGLKAK